MFMYEEWPLKKLGLFSLLHSLLKIIQISTTKLPSTFNKILNFIIKKTFIIYIFYKVLCKKHSFKIVSFFPLKIGESSSIKLYLTFYIFFKIFIIQKINL